MLVEGKGGKMQVAEMVVEEDEEVEVDEGEDEDEDEE